MKILNNDEETARDILVAAIKRLNAELLRLAGPTPENRQAWMRRINRAAR